jgi:tetratricopeptide (TPR) repeat protein
MGPNPQSPSETEARDLFRTILTAILLAALLAPAGAGALGPDRIARAVSVQGTVELQRAGGSDWAPLKLDEELSAGDTIRVGPRSRAVVALLDRSVLRLAESTTVTLRPPGPERSGVVDLLRGAVHFLTRGPRSLDVKTELVNVGVRGTEFLVAAEADATSITVFEGAVLAENAQGSLALTGGQSAVAQRGQPPVLRLVARPRDAVRWALHYPPVLDVRPADLAPEAGAKDQLRVSLTAWRQGDVGGALGAIAQVPPSAEDVRFLTYRAQLLLAVGRVDEAGADLERALAASPKDPGALSLQAIVAVVQNDRERALQLSAAAVEAAPTSATAHLARSYALQARFDLAGARSSAQRAVALDPQDALAWARLAELHAAFGQTGDALAAAQKASAVAPELSRTRTVLGYARLAEVSPSAAEKEFERAIALDSADPLPRLGLGLARIRKGELGLGARDLEIAANLAPDDALVRSYLGKAYFEEKRLGLDEREFASAKGLDPLDPTPWFYDAISKQAANRPVEALWDLERANELNDGRGVYRSRLLLDSDLAARSASLARVYGDLGFEQLALAEGWRSVETDPTSDSAHRLLADSYAALPRHEVARVSELLQAQLLQPINVTPIQPRLGESNLLLAGRGGPGSPSFNEFNPIFERDRAVAQVTTFGGDHGTGGIEPVVAGIYRNVSISAGYTGFQTDGFRVNNDQKDQIANAFVQAELSSATSVQAEYRRRDTESGDLTSRFFQEMVRSTVRQLNSWDTYRLGGRYAFSPGSIVLASFTYQQYDFHFRDPGAIEEHLLQDSAGGELQHLFRSRVLDVVSGAGYFKLTGEDTITLPVMTLTNDPGAWHANAYAYGHVHFTTSLTLTAGVSGDVFRSRSDILPNREQLNPKFGVTWSPLRGMTVRAAAFRTLKRTLITDQTLEPTHVAGFNQFFDDPTDTRIWRYGVGVDQKVSPNLFVGAEGTRRDLTVAAIDLIDGVPRDVKWREWNARGYAFWTPHTRLALRAEYSFERLLADERLTLGARDATTHRFPMGVAVFLPNGVSASATATYFHQEGTFDALGDFGLPAFRRGSADFWVVDAGLSYRLPRRYGLVSVTATNLLDQRFNFFEQSLANHNPTVQPARAVFARVTLAGP